MYNNLSKENVFFINDEFYYSNNEYILDCHIKIYTDIIANYLNKISCIVELGAGFGSKILNIASNKKFLKCPFLCSRTYKVGTRYNQDDSKADVIRC